MSDALDAQIGPVKGNPLYKGLAKFFSGLDSYARDPNNILAQGLPLPEGAGVGITSGWASLMGLPEAARFWNDRHGGFPLTEGKNQTLKLAPDVLEGGLASLPFVSGPTNTARKAALKVADKALDLSKGLPKGQLNALYGGKAGQPAPKDPDIFLSHGTSAGKLRVDKSKGGSSEPDLPQELYNISMALTRRKLSDFGGADTILVPQHGRFEPKLDQTIITATDSYSPRYGSALGYRADGGTKLDDFLRGFVSRDEFKEALQKQANRRLADQFVPIYPAGGIHQEGDKAVSKGLAAFRKFQEASQVPFTGGSARAKVISPYDFFQNRVAMSPHFQSLADYEMSPYGGQILGSQSGHFRLAAAETAAYGLLDKLVYENSFGSLDSLGSFHNGKVESLKSLASGKLLPYDRSAKGRAFDSEREAFDFSKLRYSDGNGNYLPMTPEQIREVRQTAGKILQQMKTAPSDYGELKRFGQTKVNPDTFAGIITKSDADWLPTAALKRGLAFERLPYNSPASEAVGIANDMQNAGKNPSMLSAGLPGLSRKNPNLPSYADYQLAVDKVKTAQNALKKAPTSLDAQKAFQAAADEWNSKSQSFVDASHISTGSQGAMAKYLEKQLGDMVPWEPSQPVKPLPVPSAPAEPSFGSPFLDSTATVKNWGMGHFDYIPNNELDLISEFANKTGNDPLFSAVNAYQTHPAYLNSGVPPDAVTEKLLKELDAVKSGWGTPTGLSTKAPSLMTGLASAPQKAPGLSGKLAFTPIHGKTTFGHLSEAELKAFNLHDLFKDFDAKSLLKEYDAALAKVAGTSAEPSGLAKFLPMTEAGAVPEGWNGQNAFAKVNPTLSPQQLEALETHALNKYFEKEYGSHWQQSVAESLAKLKTLFPE